MSSKEKQLQTLTRGKANVFKLPENHQIKNKHVDIKSHRLLSQWTHVCARSLFGSHEVTLVTSLTVVREDQACLGGERGQR